MNIETFFKREMVKIYHEERTQAQLFADIGAELLAKKYVTATYIDALTTRERAYPTGLRLETTSVAIPHTDADQVREQFIYVVKPQSLIEFGEMGTAAGKVEVSYLFFLGFKKGNEQPYILQELVTFFSDKQLMSKLNEATTEEQIYRQLSIFFSEV